MRSLPSCPIRNASSLPETLHLQDPRLHQEVHRPQLPPEARENGPRPRCSRHQEAAQRRAPPHPPAQGERGQRGRRRAWPGLRGECRGQQHQPGRGGLPARQSHQDRALRGKQGCAAEARSIPRPQEAVPSGTRGARMSLLSPAQLAPITTLGPHGTCFVPGPILLGRPWVTGMPPPTRSVCRGWGGTRCLPFQPVPAAAAAAPAPLSCLCVLAPLACTPFVLTTCSLSPPLSPDCTSLKDRRY